MMAQKLRASGTMGDCPKDVFFVHKRTIPAGSILQSLFSHHSSSLFPIQTDQDDDRHDLYDLQRIDQIQNKACVA